MLDKSKQLTASLSLVNDRLLFEGSVEGNSSVAIDYIPPFGDNLGYTSLELMLLSLSSCVGTALLVLLRRGGKTIEKFSIKSEGIRREVHPTAFEEIHLNIEIKAANLTSPEFEKALTLIENICPVWYMIKGSTKVVFHYKIED
ncbi:MAG: osmotically inducible protein OsmC [Bacteroidetes bacterium HGW-Bacteroidetes-8]|jgi:putative redox protein|nr:MAG: osmotically inducible protein OsmC [Bacteroidetes bacterium HGW-Bacteroidetes-8]